MRDDDGPPRGFFSSLLSMIAVGARAVHVRRRVCAPGVLHRDCEEMFKADIAHVIEELVPFCGGAYDEYAGAGNSPPATDLANSVRPVGVEGARPRLAATAVAAAGELPPRAAAEKARVPFSCRW